MLRWGLLSLKNLMLEEEEDQRELGGRREGEKAVGISFWKWRGDIDGSMTEAGLVFFATPLLLIRIGMLQQERCIAQFMTCGERPEKARNLNNQKDLDSDDLLYINAR
jgi:hypothetical protein